jgi:hypothetical protein
VLASCCAYGGDDLLYSCFEVKVWEGLLPRVAGRTTRHSAGVLGLQHSLGGCRLRQPLLGGEPPRAPAVSLGHWIGWCTAFQMYPGPLSAGGDVHVHGLRASVPLKTSKRVCSSPPAWWLVDLLVQCSAYFSFGGRCSRRGWASWMLLQWMLGASVRE